MLAHSSLLRHIVCCSDSTWQMSRKDVPKHRRAHGRVKRLVTSAVGDCALRSHANAPCWWDGCVIVPHATSNTDTDSGHEMPAANYEDDIGA